MEVPASGEGGREGMEGTKAIGGGGGGAQTVLGAETEGLEAGEGVETYRGGLGIFVRGGGEGGEAAGATGTGVGC